MTRLKRAQPPTVQFGLVGFTLSGSAEPSSHRPLIQRSIRVEPQRRFGCLWWQKHQIPARQRERDGMAGFHLVESFIGDASLFEDNIRHIARTDI